MVAGLLAGLADPDPDQLTLICRPDLPTTTPTRTPDPELGGGSFFQAKEKPHHLIGVGLSRFN
jgi:hypothetical protein